MVSILNIPSFVFLKISLDRSESLKLTKLESREKR